jgi:PKHD-type hydroxylase
MEEQQVKQINFKSPDIQKKFIFNNSDYSKSELRADRKEIDHSKYVNSLYEFKLKTEYVKYLRNYIGSIKKFYHEEFDTPNKPSYRHCELEFPSKTEHPKIYKIISNVFNEINNKYFKYDLSETLEIQIVKYDVGGNYNWHCDYGLSQNPDTDRKLSLSIQLSDKYEYQGCDLIMCDNSRRYHTLKKEIGCGVVFDSKTPHKVTHLTKGIRYSLVAWIHGPHLR